MNFSFSKRVGKTIAKGQITVPKEFDSILDRKGCCPLVTESRMLWKLGSKMDGLNFPIMISCRICSWDKKNHICPGSTSGSN